MTKENQVRFQEYILLKSDLIFLLQQNNRLVLGLSGVPGIPGAKGAAGEPGYDGPQVSSSLGYLGRMKF